MMYLDILHDYKNKKQTTARTVIVLKPSPLQWARSTSIYHEIEKEIFEPQIVKKNQTDISNIEDRGTFYVRKRNDDRDISSHLKDVYGVDASAVMISHMTARILPIAKEWQIGH